MKKLSKLLFILVTIVAVLFIAGRLALGFLLDRSSQVEITQQSRTGQYDSVSYTHLEYWDALENLELARLNPDDLNEDQKRFADAVHFLLNAELAKAECALYLLYMNGEDPSVRTKVQETLANLLFYRSKWREFLYLTEQDSTLFAESNLTEADRLFAEAMSQASPEIYHYPEHSTVVPTDLIVTGTPQIEVEINGRRKKFMLDTGASATVLASNIAEECGVEPLTQKSGKGHTATSVQVDFRPAVIAELKLGDLVIENHPAAIVDEEVLEFHMLGVRVVKIDGIIGWPVFANTVMEIDYDNGKTTIAKPERRNHADRNLFWLGYPGVMLRAENGRQVNFGLDTGAGSTSIKQHIFSKINMGPVTTSRGMRIGAGGGEQVVDKKVSDLTLYLNDHALHFDSISTTSGVKAAFLYQPDGKLGSNIARNGKILVDYLNGRFELSR